MFTNTSFKKSNKYESPRVLSRWIRIFCLW
jgi:hypothetical protein